MLADLASAQVIERNPRWTSLTPAQQQVLAPLQRDWATLEPDRRQKWLEVAAKFPRMPADERQRVQERMAEWARMTPAQRATARLQFQEVRVLPDEERQARWQAYQALPEDEKARLAQRAKPVARSASAADLTPLPTAATDADSTKRNLVRAPGQAPPRVVAPTVVQARPGATTTKMTTRVAPPPHHQAGLPKIAATAGYVDPETLLPRRGPQGAAVRSPPASEPAEQP